MNQSTNYQDDTFEISVEFTEYCRAKNLSDKQFADYLRAISFFIKHEGQVPDLEFSEGGWCANLQISKQDFHAMIGQGVMELREEVLPTGAHTWMPAGYGEVWQ